MDSRTRARGTDGATLLRKIPFFSCLSDEHLTTVQQIIRKRRFHKNEIILQEENTCQFMYVVFSGKVKVVHQSSRGREHILAFHKQGDYFGEMALLDGKTSLASVIAMEDTEVGLLAKTDFEQTLLCDSTAARHIILMLCSRLRDSWLKLKVMSLADAELKIRTVLRQFGALYGVPDRRGTIVAMKLTHKDIGEYASVARETVSRHIKKLVLDNEIEVLSGKYFLLKPEFSRKVDFQ
jgi:CRP/FNR family transcriptional regulator